MTLSYRPALPWLLAAPAVIPLTGLLHEGAHFIAYQLAGVTEVTFHFNRVDGASANHPGWALAAGAIAGPLMTLAIVAACCLGVRRFGPRPALIATGLVAPFRTFVPALWLVIHTLFGQGNNAGFDELDFARALGWPPQPLMLLEIAGVVFAMWWLVRAMPREHRKLNVIAVAVGGGLGIAAYWTLGPLILP